MNKDYAKFSRTVNIMLMLIVIVNKYMVPYHCTVIHAHIYMNELSEDNIISGNDTLN